MEAVGTVKTEGVRALEAAFSVKTQGFGKDPRPASKAIRDDDLKTKELHLDSKEEIRNKIEHIAQALDNYIKSIQRDFKIQIHEATGNIIVKVISGEDGKVLREIPSEKMLNLAAKMEEMAGILFNENV